MEDKHVDLAHLQEGMGQLRIRAGRVRLDGVSEFLFPLFAQEIGSKQVC